MVDLWTIFRDSARTDQVMLDIFMTLCSSSPLSFGFTLQKIKPLRAPLSPSNLLSLSQETKVEEAALSLCAPQIWNQPPENLRCAETADSFKQDWKHFYSSPDKAKESLTCYCTPCLECNFSKPEAVCMSHSMLCNFYELGMAASPAWFCEHHLSYLWLIPYDTIL